MIKQHASLGGSVSPTRQFLDQNPELCRNSATRKGVHAIMFIQGI